MPWSGAWKAWEFGFPAISDFPPFSWVFSWFYRKRNLGKRAPATISTLRYKNGVVWGFNLIIEKKKKVHLALWFMLTHFLQILSICWLQKISQLYKYRQTISTGVGGPYQQAPEPRHGRSILLLQRPPHEKNAIQLQKDSAHNATTSYFQIFACATSRLIPSIRTNKGRWLDADMFVEEISSEVSNFSFTTFI